MKKRFFIGIVSLFLVAIVVVFGIRHTTRQEENSMGSITVMQQEELGIDAIIASFPPEEQARVRDEYEARIRSIKASEDEKTVESFKEIYKKALQNSLNSPDIPDDPHESLQYYEEKLRKAKERGASEEIIALFTGCRDRAIKLIADLEALSREHEADRAHFASLSTPEERITYYEEELLEDEEALRLAKEKGDASAIRWAELLVKGTKQAISIEERRRDWIPKKAELDEVLRNAEASRARMIDKYRHLLHTEVVDGVEQVVGVRTPDEIESSTSEKSEGRSFPADVLSPVPTVSDDVSSSPSVVENTPIPAVEGAMQPFVKAQTEFQSWRNAIGQDYVDVLVSRYMSPQELEQYFPTAQQRKSLTHKTERLQDEVVSKMRNIVSAIPDVTHEQKHTFARNILTQNFDSEFAESVLKQLDFDDN